MNVQREKSFPGAALTGQYGTIMSGQCTIWNTVGDAIDDTKCISFHQIGHLGQFGLVVAMSVHFFVCCPLPMRFSQGSKEGPRGGFSNLMILYVWQ